MRRFRVIIQGEGVKVDGSWFGFFAGRDVRAQSEAEADRIATDRLVADWTSGDSARLGELHLSRVIACWRPWPIHREMEAGHCFYANDEHAQREAWALEAAVARAPLALRRSIPD